MTERREADASLSVFGTSLTFSFADPILPCHQIAIGLAIAMRPASSNSTLVERRPSVRIVRVPGLPPDQARLIVARGLTAEALAKRTRLIDWAVDLAAGNPLRNTIGVGESEKNAG